MRFFLISALVFAAAVSVNAECMNQQFEGPCKSDAQGCCWVTDASDMTQSCVQCQGLSSSQKTKLQQFYDEFHVELSGHYTDQWKLDNVNCDGSSSPDNPIACDFDGNVIAIQLVNDDLWSDASNLCLLTEFSHLDSLILSDNAIFGSLPACLNQVAPDHLERIMLSHNYLRGEVPSLISLQRLEYAPNGAGETPTTTQCHLTTNGMGIQQVDGGNSPETNCFECPWPTESLPTACHTIGHFNHCGFHGTESTVTNGMAACPEPNVPAQPQDQSQTTPPPQPCQKGTVSANSCKFPGNSAEIAASKNAACQATNNRPVNDMISGQATSAACVMALSFKPGCSGAVHAYFCARDCHTCEESENSWKPCASVCAAVQTKCETALMACGVNLDCDANNADCVKSIPAASPTGQPQDAACGATSECKSGLTCTSSKCTNPSSSQGGGQDPNSGATSLAVSSALVLGAAVAAMAVV